MRPAAPPLVTALVFIFVLISVIVLEFYRQRKDRLRITRFSVAKQFSRFPTGAMAADSPSCGENLRERVHDLLGEPGYVIINLDGTAGYGSSFLKAAFEGLGRIYPDLKDRLMFESEADPTLVTEIWEYITE